MGNIESLPELERTTEVCLGTCETRRYQLEEELSALVREKRKAMEKNNVESIFQVLRYCHRDLAEMESRNEDLEMKKFICERKVVELFDELHSLDADFQSKENSLDADFQSKENSLDVERETRPIIHFPEASSVGVIRKRRASKSGFNIDYGTKSVERRGQSQIICRPKKPEY